MSSRSVSKKSWFDPWGAQNCLKGVVYNCVAQLKTANNLMDFMFASSMKEIFFWGEPDSLGNVRWVVGLKQDGEKKPRRITTSNNEELAKEYRCQCEEAPDMPLEKLSSLCRECRAKWTSGEAIPIPESKSPVEPTVTGSICKLPWRCQLHCPHRQRRSLCRRAQGSLSRWDRAAQPLGKGADCCSNFTTASSFPIGTGADRSGKGRKRKRKQGGPGMETDKYQRAINLSQKPCVAGEAEARFQRFMDDDHRWLHLPPSLWEQPLFCHGVWKY